MESMELTKLSPEELERLFEEGGSVEPQHIVGRWKGIFLPVHRISPIPLKGVLTSVLSRTWGKIWKGKEFFLERGTSDVMGINIVAGLRILKFRVKKSRSRIDSKDVVEFDYSLNPPPVGFVRDEMRTVRGQEGRVLVGVMFVEFLGRSFPFMFFGLERA